MTVLLKLGLFIALALAVIGAIFFAWLSEYAALLRSAIKRRVGAIYTEE